VTVIQRFGGGLNLNLHFHTLVLDGVFTDGGEDTLRFRPLPPPTDDEIGGVLVALGPRSGARVWRVGEEPDAPWVLSNAPRHAHIAGFDLHANVAVPAADRARLEQPCRYLLRPPVAQDRLRRMGDDRILLTLKTPWADGTRHLIFAPMELLEKLAALTPRPRINLIIYHGVLAPHARWRARAVAYGALPGTAATAPNLGGDSDDHAASPSPPRHWAWANLMRRAFDIDVLTCPRCGGRLRLLGTIEDPAAIRAILDSLAASVERVDRAPPPVTLEPATLAAQA